MARDRSWLGVARTRHWPLRGARSRSRPRAPVQCARQHVEARASEEADTQEISHLWRGTRSRRRRDACFGLEKNAVFRVRGEREAFISCTVQLYKAVELCM